MYSLPVTPTPYTNEADTESQPLISRTTRPTRLSRQGVPDASRGFLINLAVIDIAVCALAMPCFSLTLLEGRWIFEPVLCKIVAFLKTVSLFAGALSLCVIAVDRYRKLGSGLTAAAPLLGQGGYKLVCSVNWLYSPSYTIFCFISFGFIPVLFMSYCYLSITLHIHQRKKRLQRSRAFAVRSLTAWVNPDIQALSRTRSNPGPPPPSKINSIHITREEIGVLKTMVVVVFFFSIVAIPYIIMRLISL
ncbi:neuropeptide Y receptor type 6-like [Acanthaster planci]|uniref:Neuropeptide Y receptor type 6-like n=1 Tax=Acanthaster planci TaxID=133434 RepID=A0A8B7XU89_ACAPL|nr:neuropeptide Y receptor type 6-like [Acanthaster planci]